MLGGNRGHAKNIPTYKTFNIYNSVKWTRLYSIKKSLPFLIDTWLISGRLDEPVRLQSLSGYNVYNPLITKQILKL